MNRAHNFLYILLISWITQCIPTIADQPEEVSISQLPSIFTGCRIGLGLGLEYNNVDVKLKIQPPSNLNFIQSQLSQSGKQFQVAPSIEFGKTFSKDYYLGILASWRYSGLKTTANVPIIATRYFIHEFTLNNYGDILIKGGYHLAPRMMLYGLVGPSIASWSHTSTQFNAANQSTSTFKINKTSLGLGLGAGLEYLINNKYAISVDYNYHLHNSAAQTQVMTITPVNIAKTGSVNKKIDLSFSTIAIRFTTFFSL